MKKLSIVLALIMALSCFSLTAFAADESTTAAETTTAAQPGKVVIGVNLFDLEGNLVPSEDGKPNTITLNYDAVPGAKLTAADIINAVKIRLGEEEVDLTKYALNETVVAYDDVDADGAVDNPYNFTETKVVGGQEYYFVVAATEIDYEAVLAETIGEQLAKIDWAGIAKANVTLINQLITASKAAIDSLVNAEWPDAAKKDETTTAETTTAATEETPDTGVSAVAGAAVVVLALSATTAVVLRKKED